VLIAQGFSRQTMTVFFARPALTLKRFLKACQFAAWSWPVSTLSSYRLRRWYLVRVLRYHIDPTASIHTGCWVTGFRLSIGSHSVINRQCRLDARGGLSIGSNVSISPECYLISASHDPHSSSFAGSSKATSISIGDYAWLGVRAVVLPGVSIGRGAVVGAGAVVTRDVEPMAIVAGNPAHVIGQRRCEPTYRLDWRPWFDTDICS
jgi:acetyltransferase-like isoleucine patch superfamily enzyme